MYYQDLNGVLADVAGVYESAINKDTDISTLQLDDEGYEKIVEALAEEMEGEPDIEYIKCLQTVGELFSYANGE